MDFYTIHPREISDVLRQTRAVIIDVREKEEFMDYHYCNAINCPYDEMDTWIWRLKRNRALILYCEYGSTSLLAARRLAKEGYKVYTVIGGIHAIRKYLDE